MRKKIAVIGSNSFSGAHFVDYILEEGAEVIGISRSSEPNPVFLPYKNRQNPTFRFYQLDLNNDLEEIIKIVKAFAPDYVVNFAAQSMVGESWQHPEHWFQTNVVAMVKLHDQLRLFNFLKKYVHISTPEVYGSCEGLVQENTNYNPSTPYAVSRAAADMSLKTFFDAYDFPVVFTRAANVYGPGQQLYRIIPRAILYFMLGKKLQLHGGGHSVRSFIHIRDVADGTLRAARNGGQGEIYHLSTTRNISIRALVKMIAEQMKLSFEDNIEDVGERMGKDAAYLLDSAKAREALGWKDQISLEQGIEETIAWVRDNLDELKRQPFDYIHKP
ncbi:GDP-mannose 4,6-dehydratase [Patescibacteria group bacterium]|nr:GDP-mannose 4,6-dehydratase [Patescibacteria group bacterium]MBU4069258.1 GDP-mannose 4,6-dehydratase [Pseudomonadota bacterium]